ncbi:hypothetical protein HET73_06530 [Wolbachia endosymbiont of Atemnus politus]|nr:hypothetical protein [Wolbachia endosymbiont of Atemnus politus]
MEDHYGKSPLNIINTNRFYSSFYSNLTNKTDGASQRILERIGNLDSQNLDNTKTQVMNLDSSGPSSCINKVVPPCNQVEMGR